MSIIHVHKDTPTQLAIWRRASGEIRYAVGMGSSINQDHARLGAPSSLETNTDHDTNMVYDPAADLWYLTPSYDEEIEGDWITVMAFPDRDSAKVAIVLGCTVEFAP